MVFFIKTITILFRRDFGTSFKMSKSVDRYLEPQYLVHLDQGKDEARPARRGFMVTRVYKKISKHES